MSAWLERQQARTIKPAADVPAEDVTHQRISLYKDSPSGEVCIEEFERFAIDRLRGECVLTTVIGVTSTRGDNSIEQDAPLSTMELRTTNAQHQQFWGAKSFHN